MLHQCCDKLVRTFSLGSLGNWLIDFSVALGLSAYGSRLPRISVAQPVLE